MKLRVGRTVWLGCVLAAACQAGKVSGGGGGSDGGGGLTPDAAGGGLPDASAVLPDASLVVPDAALPDAGSPDAMPGPVCDPAVATTETGHHRPGQDCLTCHDGSKKKAPIFTAAGTIYTDLAGTAPLPGATIHLVDAAGVDHTAVSALDGNFWMTDPIGFPGMARASSCPDLRVMTAPVAATGAGCNQVGCHSGGNRISLP